MISNCCGAEIIKNSDLCSKCKEHCEPTYTAEDLKGKSFEEQIQIIEGVSNE
jgi:hypothetical protein